MQISFYVNSVETKCLFDYCKESDREFYTVLGKNVKLLRLKNKYKQVDLANYLNISVQQYHKYEKGTNRFSLKMVLKLIDLFKIEPHELLGNNGKNLTENLHKKIDRQAKQLNETNEKIKQLNSKVDALIKAFEKSLDNKEKKKK